MNSKGREMKTFKETMLMEAKVDINKIIQDLIDTDWSKDNKSQMKAVQLLKGIALSDEPKANSFMSKIDKFTSNIDVEKL